MERVPPPGLARSSLHQRGVLATLRRARILSSYLPTGSFPARGFNSAMIRTRFSWVGMDAQLPVSPLEWVSIHARPCPGRAWMLTHSRGDTGSCASMPTQDNRVRIMALLEPLVRGFRGAFFVA